MKSYSQVGQDLFAFEQIGAVGKFLDIGCNHPTEISNTYALELEGWTGLLLDNDMFCAELCTRHRKNPVLLDDATTIDWTAVLAKLGIDGFDYLSLDVDQASADALENLLKHGVAFKCATIEHDAYRFGDAPRQRMRKLMADHGYKLYRANVEHNGCDFEDWWTR